MAATEKWRDKKVKGWVVSDTKRNEGIIDRKFLNLLAVKWNAFFILIIIIIHIAIN